MIRRQRPEPVGLQQRRRRLRLRNKPSNWRKDSDGGAKVVGHQQQPMMVELIEQRSAVVVVAVG